MVLNQITFKYTSEVGYLKEMCYEIFYKAS